MDNCKVKYGEITRTVAKRNVTVAPRHAGCVSCVVLACMVWRFKQQSNLSANAQSGEAARISCRSPRLLAASLLVIEPSRAAFLARSNSSKTAKLRRLRALSVTNVFADDNGAQLERFGVKAEGRSQTRNQD